MRFDDVDERYVKTRLLVSTGQSDGVRYCICKISFEQPRVVRY